MPDKKESDKGEFMTFYQELQLNQAGSKAVICASKSKKEKYSTLSVYLFKILLTVGILYRICNGIRRSFRRR